MLRRKKLYTVCISCILAFVMIFTSAGFGNTVYGNEAENVSYEGEVQTKADNAGTLKPMIQKTEIVDSAYEADNERESIARLYSASSEWSKYSSDYYYNMLADNEKILYDRLEASVLKYAESSDNVSNIKFGNEYYTDNVDCKDLELTNERVQFVVELFYQTESQYFFLKNEWSVSKTSDGRVVAAAIAVYDEFTNGAARQAYIRQFNSVIDAWSEQAQMAEDTYGKVKIIHNLICGNVTYQAGNFDQSAASALLDYGVFDMNTVCAGYAKAFQILCNGLGIDTIITVSATHAWNCVNIDGCWYITDCTYDKSFYEYGKSPYLAISQATLRDVSNYDSAHDVREDWKLYQPLCLYDYGRENQEVSWDIGENITATLDSDGVLTVAGIGGTYDYEEGESPISGCEYIYGINKVVVQSGITRLGRYVFTGGYFDTIELPDTLTIWSDKAFSNCENVVNIINNSSLKKSFTIFGDEYSEYDWKDINTGNKVTEIPEHSSVQRIQNIAAEGITLNYDNAQLVPGDVLQLTAIVNPDNATVKDITWTSSNPAVADVDENGLVNAYTQGSTQIIVQCGDVTAICDITVYIPDASLYEFKQGDDGNWYMFVDGDIDYDYTGMALNDYGWWMLTNGTVDFTYTGMALNNYGWWYITNGALDLTYTGMALNDFGWWMLTNGTVDFTYTGMALNNYGWWYITNGALDLTYTGMALNDYGWWYITNGALDLTYTGMALNEYGWWYMTKGMVDYTYNDLGLNKYGWWKITNGALDLGYNSLSENEYGLWKVTNGTVDFGFNGQIEYEGIVYNIVNGHAE